MEDTQLTFKTIVFPVAKAGPTFHAHMRTFLGEKNENENSSMYYC